MSTCDLPKNNVAGVIIGVDPGVSGAIAAISTLGNPIAVYDMPVISEGTKQQTSTHLAAAIFKKIAAEHNVLLVVLEHVTAMPKQGVTSSFNFGMNYGILRGVIGTLELPVTTIRPTIWKKFYQIGHDKDKARKLALDTWPTLAEKLKRKKDVDRAEAMLLANYGRLKLNH